MTRSVNFFSPFVLVSLLTCISCSSYIDQVTKKAVATSWRAPWVADDTHALEAKSSLERLAISAASATGSAGARRITFAPRRDSQR